eukprot:EG_transcript_15730
MRLKCQHSSGQCVVTVADDAALEDLLALLAKETGIAAHRQALWLGFPPAAVPAEDRRAPLQRLGFRSGETVRVEETAEPAGEAAAAGGPAVAPLTAVPDVLDATLFREGGAVVKRAIQADNSCLFNTVQYVCEGNHARDGAAHLRRLVAEVVAGRPEEYCDAVLGKPNAEYCAWILKPESWGGAIELAILSERFQTEIRCLDVQTGRMHAFGEGQGYPRCVYAVYDGIHYDALAFTVCAGAPEEMDITLFAPGDDAVRDAGLRLVAELQRTRQFTDVAGFTLRCLTCQTGLKGQQEAQAHAKETGHTNFNEY